MRHLMQQWVWLTCVAGFLLLAGGQGSQAASTSSPHFPVPKVLQPNIAFWKQVFTKVNNDGGVLHDAYDLRIVYHTFSTLPASAQGRKNLITSQRQYYRTILEALATGKRQGLSADERRVLGLFRGKQMSRALRAAMQDIRFQGGMRGKFVTGLARSGAYMPTIERIFADAGLPRDLTLLPHVESSFVNRAYSKRGAAGIWQFMPSTARRFIRVNRYVDERLDVRRASQAAAKLLRGNYRLLGTWPLAITAYNHGANGMRKAVAAVGTTDIGAIVQRYEGARFGFASRNFYAEFLAAVDVAHNYKQYFGNVAFAQPRRLPTTTAAAAVRRPAPSSWKYRVRQGDTLSKLAQRHKTTTSRLAALNGLRKPYVIQRGQLLKISGRGASGQVQAKSQSSSSWKYRVRQGDTLSKLAQRHKTTTSRLAALNGLRKPYVIQRGQLLKIPGRGASVYAQAKSQPVPRQRYKVRRGDTLSSVAKRFDTTVKALAALNKLRQPYMIKSGQVLMVPRPALQAALSPTLPSAEAVTTQRWIKAG